MPKGESFSRRDFLKTAGLGVAAAGTTLFSACGDQLKAIKDLEITYCSLETILYNGNPTLISELPEKAREIYDRAKSFTNYYSNTGGYLGAKFPSAEGWSIDEKKVVVRIDETDTGECIGQVLYGRKVDSTYSLVDEGSQSEQFLDSIRTANAYGDHSLLVIGPNGNEYWFDNVESLVGNTKARIAVDAKSGKIYQIIIIISNPNIFQKWFESDRVDFQIHEIDVLKGDYGFINYTISPFNPGFLEHVEFFANSVKNTINSQQNFQHLSEEEKRRLVLEAVIEVFANPRSVTMRTLEENLGIYDENNNLTNRDYVSVFFEFIKKYTADLPLTREEYLIVLKGLADNLLNFSQSVKQSLGGIISTINPIKENPNLNNILKERVYIPQAKPDLYVIKIFDTEQKIYRYFLIGFYNFWEYGLDETVWGNRYKYNLATTPMPFGFGEIDENTANNYTILKNLEQCEQLPVNFQELAQIEDRNQNKDLWKYSIDNIRYKITFNHINPKAVKWIWDAAAGKIRSGIYLEENGQDKILILKLDDGLNDNLDKVSEFSNRWSLVGSSPNYYVDVTERVEELRKSGYSDVSPLGLSDLFSALLLTNLPHINELYQYFNDHQLISLLTEQYTNINFLGLDNNLVVCVEEGIEIHKFDKNGNKINTIKAPYKMVFNAKKVGETISDEPYVVIGEVTGEDGENYKFVVRQEDAFPLSARSNAKIFLENAAILASVYAGIRTFGSSEIVKNFKVPIKELIRVIAEKIIR